MKLTSPNNSTQGNFKRSFTSLVRVSALCHCFSILKLHSNRFGQDSFDFRGFLSGAMRG